MNAAATTPIPSSEQELRVRVDQLTAENRVLELKVQKLQRMLWDKKSERMPTDDNQGVLFTEPAAAKAECAPVSGKKRAVGAARAPKGPQPLDPALPRELIQVPAPQLKELICPVTKQPMQPGFVERIEVLARRAPVYYVKAYERTVFVSPAKTAPVYSAWPADILPRARVHASVVAHIAAAHYSEHVPFHRLEQQLARTGVELARSTQVSLMNQLDTLVAPLMVALRDDVFSGGYLHVDATPVDVCDPARPGHVREATLWAYRAKRGGVWFEYSASKSPVHPDATLKAARFKGFCQTDGAPGLNTIGPPGQVTSLGCHTHARRGFFDADKAGDPRAKWYLERFRKLFRVEQLAQRHGRKEILRRRFSVPIFQAMLTQAEQHAQIAPAKTALGDAVRYLLDQQERLHRCLTEIEAEISNNAVERAIRPLKVGARNWMFVGDPKAGPRLANLFTLVENCRLIGLDPERYLIELLGKLQDHPASRIKELLPHRWTSAQQTQTALGAPSASAAASPGPDR
ncbi:IS66 family transposase [Opitutus sp. ER46]|uniref:IS66 family transposase n=1 Tax=Opitutus sp. ER46 TaxID=2161864 RepID=UPI000D31CE27|nr:IS66 family transposase [Opitutus sp. ER46]PTY01373.1 IS66 family transposase [Opitutus sp. ER46]